MIPSDDTALVRVVSLLIVSSRESRPAQNVFLLDAVSAKRRSSRDSKCTVEQQRLTIVAQVVDDVSGIMKFPVSRVTELIYFPLHRSTTRRAHRRKVIRAKFTVIASQRTAARAPHAAGIAKEPGGSGKGGRGKVAANGQEGSGGGMSSLIFSRGLFQVRVRACVSIQDAIFERRHMYISGEGRLRRKGGANDKSGSPNKYSESKPGRARGICARARACERASTRARGIIFTRAKPDFNLR